MITPQSEEMYLSSIRRYIVDNYSSVGDFFHLIDIVAFLRLHGLFERHFFFV